MASRDLVQSLQRGLTILEMVASSSEGLVLSEISERLGVKTPTAFNLTKTLVHEGYLEKTGRPVRYRLGGAVTGLINVQQRRQWVQNAGKAVQTIYDELDDANVVVGEMVGGDVIVRLRKLPNRPDIMEVSPHRPLSPYTTALSVAFLAFLPTPDLQACQRLYPFAEYGLGFWGSEDRFDQFLNDARERGYVQMDWNPPFRAAAPIYGMGGQVVACIGASYSLDGEPDEVKQQKLTMMICQHAQDLSAE